MLEGRGKFWREPGEPAEIELIPGLSLNIPTGVHFQFRNTSQQPLRILIVTMPPWNAAINEAYRVKDYWQTAENCEDDAS